MTIEKTTTLNDIHIFFNPDMSIASATRRDYIQIVEDDILISDTFREGVMDANSLALAVNAAMANVILQVGVLQDGFANTISVMQTNNDNLVSVITILTANNDSMATNIIALTSQVSDLEAQVNASANAQIVTPAQARLALSHAGLLDSVQTFMNTLPSSNDILIYWEYTNMFERNNPLVLMIGAELGMSNSQMDGLFVLAKTF